MDKKFVIEGFAFDNAQDYGDARKEAEAVSFIRAKLDMNNINEVIKTYGKLTQKKQIFVTPIGISFLKELRDKIVESGVIADENLKFIEVNTKIIEKSSSEAENFRDTVEKGLRNQIDYLKDRILRLRIVIVFMAVIAAAIAALTVFGKNTFINAEIKVQDKYSAWEKELNEREEKLNELEEQLKNSR